MKNKKVNNYLKKIQKEHEEGMDLIGQIIAYEQGDLNNKDCLELFAELIRSGQAWTLQGTYGRTAKALIDIGHINKEGKILIEL